MNNNLLDNLPAQLPAEQTDVLVTQGNVRIERIISTGHSSPDGFWYDQAEAEWVTLLSGQAQLQFEDGMVVDLVPGDHVCIAAHRKHRVQWTSDREPTVWLAVFMGEPPA